jgi:hypothetical protein
LHNEVLHNLYFPTNIITMIKSRKEQWAMTRMGGKEYVNDF